MYVISIKTHLLFVSPVRSLAVDYIDTGVYNSPRVGLRRVDARVQIIYRDLNAGRRNTIQQFSRKKKIKIISITNVVNTYRTECIIYMFNILCGGDPSVRCWTGLRKRSDRADEKSKKQPKKNRWRWYYMQTCCGLWYPDTEIWKYSNESNWNRMCAHATWTWQINDDGRLCCMIIYIVILSCSSITRVQVGTPAQLLFHAISLPDDCADQEPSARALQHRRSDPPPA